jgi:hypothetical protein
VVDARFDLKLVDQSEVLASPDLEVGERVAHAVPAAQALYYRPDRDQGNLGAEPSQVACRIGKRVHESVREGRVTQPVSSVAYLASITVDTTDGRSGSTECFAEDVTAKTTIRRGGAG